ncbi:SAM-dependent methyltransferase [Prochlorococcus sp. AH-716-I19]|nr:SAM-dependent methyltransferase [Prochlorococcus sp. AH-716-I19]
MKSQPANNQEWLIKKILKKGGTISFYDYMDFVLNDINNGYYGSGRANLGSKGDFVTSPSMSDDFSFLLSKQIYEWLIQLKSQSIFDDKLSVIEFGAGDGSLMSGLLEYFSINDKKILKNVCFIIIEPNKGMIKKQQKKLKKYLKLGFDILWRSLEDFEDRSLNGVVLANEVLDALPVERIINSKGKIHRQGVSIDKKSGRLFFEEIAITQELEKSIASAQEKLDINIPPEFAPEGWTTEWHLDNKKWLKAIYAKINNGILLIIDYAKEAKRYYSLSNSNGTLISYKNQKIVENIFESPGDCDLTSHICIESLIHDSETLGFETIGIIKQGEALLLLGLAERLFEIQNELKDDISKALSRREALLRLVDPICLGDFKWFVFSKFNNKKLKINSICIR